MRTWFRRYGASLQPIAATPTRRRLANALRSVARWIGMLPAPATASFVLLATGIPFLLGVPDGFSGSAWTAEPWRGFAMLAAAAALFLAGQYLALYQLIGLKGRRLWLLVGIPSAALALMWCTFLGFWMLMADMYIPYGRSLAAQVEEQRTRPGIEIAPDGKSVTLRMGFEHGISRRLLTLLRGHPRIRTIALSGPGGYSYEGIRVANIIRARGLDTRVQERCSSACALAFLAGRRRELLATGGEGYLGFHLPSTWGPNGRKRSADTSDEDEAMRTSGATPAFVWRVNQTDWRELWHPSPAELAAGGIPVTLLGPYDVPGERWGGNGFSRAGTVEHFDPRGKVSAVLGEREPAVLRDVVTWAMHARENARNEYQVHDWVSETLGRVLALRLSTAPDAEVRKAATYIRAAMEVIRPKSDGRCARLGARPNLAYAAYKLPGPPDSASDPDDPYGALLRRVYGKDRYAGWPAGISLPDGSSEVTWSRREHPPRAKEDCATLLTWYADAIRIDNADGPRLIRERFAAFAKATVLPGAPANPAAGLSAALRR